MLVCILQGASVLVFATDEQQTDTDKPVAEETVENDDGGSTDKDTGEDTDEDADGDDNEEDEEDPEAAIVNDGSAALSFADESALEYCNYIDLTYLETGAVLNRWSFPYSDRFFEIPSSEFSVKMAQGSLGLAVSAFRSNRFDLQYETFLSQAGFYNLHPFGYDKPTEEDSLSGVIGMKVVNGRTVIAAVTCGQGYKKEWAGNMKVGKGVRHQGFNTGAHKLEAQLENYIKENNIEGDKVLWITGMSRAAAIANLTAADAIESGEYADVYAYLFGVPRVTKAPVKYAGIYNICGQYDAVPSIPMQTWGYERYGIDLYTPSQEADDSFPVFALAVNDIGNALDGKGFRNNPEINYQLRLMIEFMGELFDGNEDYADRFQDIMVRAVNNHAEDQMMEILTEAFRTLKPQNKKEEMSLTTVVNYLSYIVAQHMRADQRQIDDGSWDPTESLNSNLMIEHRPSTYVKWVFCDIYPEEKFMSPIESRRVTVNGKAAVTVYTEGFAIAAINEAGRVYSPDPDLPEEISGEHSVFMMRNGEETIVSLPYAQEYTIEIKSEGIRNISYLDVIVTPEKLVPDKVAIHLGRLRNGGTIRMHAVPGKPLSEPELIKGDYHPMSDTEYIYSPTVIMNNELQATRHAYLSLGGAFTIVRIILIGSILMILVCGGINIRHRRKIKKEGHPPYSDLYVIIPYIICITASACMTQFSGFFLYTIPAARAQCATVTMIFITMLAVRGTLKSKKPMAFLVTVLLGMLTYCTYKYYNELLISSYSSVNALVYFALTAFLAAVACQTFRREKEDGTEDKAELTASEAAPVQAEAAKKPAKEKKKKEAKEKPEETEKKEKPAKTGKSKKTVKKKETNKKETKAKAAKSKETKPEVTKQKKKTKKKEPAEKNSEIQNKQK